jgi:pyridoxine 5-phosphate synthase
MLNLLRLGVNIDHVATLRNARGGHNPCPIRAALIAHEAGADGITAHLREDRRHIKDHDIERLMNEVPLPLNLEMTEEMLSIALKTKPNAVCIVPEKREEVTTEGGLDVRRFESELTRFTNALQHNGSRVSLFIDPDMEQIKSAARTGANIVELHTGSYAHNPSSSAISQLSTAATAAHTLGLEVHAGHGLTFDNVSHIAAIPELVELNIGHFLIGESVFGGLKATISHMKKIMREARL